MRLLQILAALSGALAVTVGAFAAHMLSGQSADWMKTGAHYQLVHAVAALVAVRMGATGAGWAFIGGSAVFAGTLYAMAHGAPHSLGAITPLGGVVMIIGWLMLAIATVRTED